MLPWLLFHLLLIAKEAGTDTIKHIRPLSMLSALMQWYCGTISLYARALTTLTSQLYGFRPGFQPFDVVEPMRLFCKRQPNGN